MADVARDEDGGHDAAGDLDFVTRLRMFAFEAHQVLRLPDRSFDDLMDVHWRAWSLLHEARGKHGPEIDRWILVTRQAITAWLNEPAMEAVAAGVA